MHSEFRISFDVTTIATYAVSSNKGDLRTVDCSLYIDLTPTKGNSQVVSDRTPPPPKEKKQV